MNLFNPDSPIMQAISRIADLVVLNILTLLLSLPIVTAGAALTALHYAVDKVFTDEGTMLKNYFSAFRSNFGRSTVYWLLLLVLGGSSAAVLLLAVGNALPTALLITSCCCLLCCGFVFVWIFPLQARFENKALLMLRNAVICALSWPLRSLAALALYLLPLLILLFLDAGLFLRLMPLWLGIWLSACSWASRRLMGPPLKQLESGARQNATPSE